MKDPKVDIECVFELVTEDRSYHFGVMSQEDAQQQDLLEFLAREKERIQQNGGEWLGEKCDAVSNK